MTAHRFLPAVLLLATACGTAETTSWIEGSSYRWDLFNHRVSHIHFAAEDGGGGSVAIVGGTSTTNLPTDLDPECESSTCSEFPFTDEAHVVMDLVSLTSKKERTGVATAELLVGMGGTSTDVTVDFGGKAKGELVAVIQGYTLDTNEPLTGGTACYQPRNGWLPRRIAMSVGEPVLSDDRQSATVTVDATFEAGLTFEDERQCLDAVVDQAQVRLDIDVLVIAGAEVASHTVNQAATYPYGEGSDPLEQPDPDEADRTYDLGEADALGWSNLDFRFHQEPGDERGAYIRTLTFLATPDGFVTGHANNYSPPTQLSGFDYVFEGTVQAMQFRGEVERERVEDLVEIELDEDGVPVPVAL